MIVDFIFSAEGFSFVREFAEKFDCVFRIDEPSGDSLLLDVGENSYRIKSDETVEEFKALITESLKSGKNLLRDRYKTGKVEYNDSMIY